jgi:hypothetical protein
MGKPVAFPDGHAPLLPNRPPTQWFRSVRESAVRGDHLRSAEFYRWEAHGDGAEYYRWERPGAGDDVPGQVIRRDDDTLDVLDTWPGVWLYRVACPSGWYEVAAVEPEPPEERGKPEIRQERFAFGGDAPSAAMGKELEIARDLVGGLMRQKSGPKGTCVLTLEEFAQQAPVKYWEYVEKHDERPSNEEMAHLLFASTATFDRRKRDWIDAGGQWPPPRPVS